LTGNADHGDEMATTGSGKLAKPNGRAAQAQASRSTILDAAERIFASYGYEGATMSLIAKEAGQAQALLHYHFATKENLYEEVFNRRASEINRFRQTAIDTLFSGADLPSLEKLLDVLFSPAPATEKGGGSSPAFSQIVAAVVVAEDPLSKSIVTRHYDPIAQRFIGAFRKIMPTLSHSDAVWAYLFAHGARMQAYSQSGRHPRLNKSRSRRIDLEQAVESLKTFAAAGIRSLAAVRGEE
jgi:AcrR family transcriptional regulator